MEKQVKYTIGKVADSERAATSDVLEENLLKTLANRNPQGLNTSFTFVARDEAGAHVGGVVAACSYGWVNVKILWVADAYRRQGIGHELMSHAHREAKRLGCHSAWLDTSDRLAREFYEKLGYGEFGVLANQTADMPPAHRRWFMQRRLPEVT